MTVSGLIKNTNIIRIHPDDTIASAISKLNSSHDAAFAFDENDKYFGVINPYYCLIKTSAPSNAKVTHCIFHAPHVKVNYLIAKVAQLMIESKVHYLPVFDDNDKFLGIISARRLLSTVKGIPVFKQTISWALKNKKKSLVTIYDDEFISSALNMFKTNKVSKLVVVNRDLKLKGILTYYGLIAHLISPKTREASGERTGDKTSFHHQLIKNFAKSYILCLTPDDLLEEALRLIIEKKIGSVVITDKNKHPVGIITTKDFLSLLSQGHKEEMLEFVSKDLSQENRQIVGGFFSQISHWVTKLPDVVKARLFIHQEKQGGVFKVNLSLFPKKGEPTVIKEEGKNLVKVLKNIKKD